MTVNELVTRLGGQLTGDGSLEIAALASLAEARPGDVSFFKDAKYAAPLAATRASAVLVPSAWQGDCPAPALIRVADPNAAFAKAAEWFAPPPVVRAPGIHPTAVIGQNVRLGKDVHIGPWTVIEDDTVIGDRAVIEAQVFIGQRVELGEDSHIYPQVTIREECKLGRRVILHSGVRIGGDGYGYNPVFRPDGTISIEKIPQLGSVELGDDVEVGCNTTIDRARFGRTRIGNATKIDNLVQIGHNVQIGDYSGIIAQAGVAGSTRIGSGCLIWAQAGLSGHLTIGDRAQVGPKSGLSKDVPEGEYYLGLPAIPKRDFAATLLVPRQVEKLKRQVAELTAKLDALAAENG
ncbi:MAG TPA: UDP-3-O-(3-hydroxymyristoyl)glucosamine N-acyltransferase [Kiritimatiellia bacterium]|nr:UDP-3-O-(3-hydroxymyristoyl)glucosamine N-acyltransferase [Kiritimatiellia bacterium]HPS09345.1 UDP-3-O-(3-hydroxymyristoyl)glucosamine N-acyltransferase [Kiritimatiellia bacterium]